MQKAPGFFWLHFPQHNFILCLFMSTTNRKYRQVFFTGISIYQEDRTRLFIVVPVRRKHSRWYKLKQGRFSSHIRKNLLHWGQLSSATGYPEGLCIQFPILGGFEGLKGNRHETSGLTLELTMLWTGGWTRSLLKCLPTWVILWSYEMATFCMLEQTTAKEKTSSPYGCTGCKQQQYKGNSWLWCP